MVYAGFRGTRLDIPDPPPALSAPDLHDEENMDARPDQEEMGQAKPSDDQQIPAAVGEAREEGLQGPGRPTVTLAQDCTRVLSLRVYVCGRGYGGWFSSSTGRRSG